MPVFDKRSDDPEAVRDSMRVLRDDARAQKQHELAQMYGLRAATLSLDLLMKPFARKDEETK